MDPAKERELKQYFFGEYVRLQSERNENLRIYEKFITERKNFDEDMKRLNEKILQERRRLREENEMFAKKTELLEDAFFQLDLDRRQLERDKIEFELSKKRKCVTNDGLNQPVVDYDVSILFRGVTSPSSLKKRYRELMKMFHPDNLSGDESVISVIGSEYRRLKVEYEKKDKK